MIRSRACALLFVVAASLAACGKNPNSPSNYAQIAGNWTGNLQSSNWNAAAVNVVLSQSNDAISGTWASGSFDWNGTITGTVSKTSFTGTFSLSAPRTGGGRCSATAAVSGPASTTGNTVTWTGAGFTGDCTGLPVGVTFNLQR